MKKFILLIALFIILTNIRAQNENLDFKGAIKFSNQVTLIDRNLYHNEPGLYDMLYSKGSYEFFRPTFAVLWQNKRHNFHELEFTDFSFSSGYTMSSSVRYEYIVNLYKDKNRKLVPSLGFGINPYFVHDSYLPKEHNQFASTTNYTGAKVFVTPRLTYYCGNVLFIDLNIPLAIYDMYYKSYHVDDPTLTIEEQTTKSWNFGTVFPYYLSVRLGIGIKFF